MAKRHRMYKIRNPDILTGMSQRALAEKAGCSQSLISQIITGRKRAVSKPTARDISKALEMEFDSVWESTDRSAWQR